MNNIINLIRSDLRNFEPYSSACCKANTGRIWLNANELPWENENNLGSFPLNRYPDKQPAILINKLAHYYNVEENQTLITRGSDEGIDLLIRLFCTAKKDRILVCPPTFGMYEIYAKLQGIDIFKVALKTGCFNLDINQILSRWDPSVKLIFLCSPNNPTGNVMSTKEILQLCRELTGKAIIVVDEAYIEFSNSKSLSIYINAFSNLVVLRTLSKAFGLAGLRVGILFSNQTIVSWLQKILPPYPLTTFSIKSAINAFEEKQLHNMKKMIEVIQSERKRLINTIKLLSIVKKVWPSEANFIFVKFNRPVEKECQRRGIMLRSMQTQTGILNCMRITIGTPSENSELLKLLGEL